MIRRTQVYNLLFLVAFSFAFSCRTVEPPNVLLILVDDLGKYDLSYYGSAIHQTPHIDQLAGKSRVFEQAYANYPRCVASRFALFAGQYPIWEGEVPDDGFHIPATATNSTLKRLRTAGYETALFGKWHLSPQPKESGFDHTFAAGAAGSPRRYFHPFNAITRPSSARKAPIPGIERLENADSYLTDLLTERFVRWLGSRKAKPFFACLSYYAVHQPLEAKPEYEEENRIEIAGHDYGEQPEFVPEGTGRTKMRQDNPVYAGMVENLDSNIGHLLESMKDLGLDQNTIVIFTSDHGGLSNDGYRQRNLATSNAPLRAGKGWLYDGGIKVPLFVSLPGQTDPIIDSTSLVLLMDLIPAFTKLVYRSPGTRQPASSIPGNWLLSGMADQKEERTIFWHAPHARPRNTGEGPASAVRRGPWKLIDFYQDDRQELYYLPTDPGERQNLIEKEPERADALLKSLNTWKRSLGAKP